MDLFNRPQLPELKRHYTMAEGKVIIDETIAGRRDAHALFQEAFLQTDFPNVFNAQVNRELVPQYPAAPSQHEQFTRPVVLKDLRRQGYKEVWPVLGGEEYEGGVARIQSKVPLVGPNNEYPAASLSDSNVELKLDKYGLRLPFTLEMIINDELDVLAGYPEALAQFMRLLEDIVVAEALIQPDRNGALASITRITGNPVLSPDSIAAAQQQLANSIVHGNVTNIGQNLSDVALLVPRTLYQAALRYTSIATYDYTDTTVTPNRIYKGVANPAFGMKVILFDALTIVNTSTKATATWYMVANAGSTFGRPGLAAAKLRGFLQPQQFISSPNALTPAGGAADWQDGSFLNDSIEFKIRHFFGSTIVFSEGILVSEGS